MEWEVTLCKRRCGRLAECLLDGEPYCVDCADWVIGRWVARDIAPHMPVSEDDGVFK